MKWTKKIGLKVFINSVLLFTIIISVFPILWVILSSFKTNAQILSDPFALPKSIDFKAFSYVFENYDFIRYIVNSLIVSLVSTVVAIVFYSMSAYVFAKYEFPFKKILYSLFIITLLVPVQSKAQPIFSLITKLNLYDTLTGLTLVYMSTGMAMSLFILKATFMSIPYELNEAAELEGASFLQTFFKINFPLAKNGITTAGILMFLNNWNEYFYASLLTSSSKNRTLPIALQFFNEAFSYDYTKLFAALTVVVLPGIIIYTVAQEKVQESVASSGIKG